MASLLERFRRARPHDAEEQSTAAADDAPPAPAPRRRPLPPAGVLRRERRTLLRLREQRVRDLGGLVLEMFRQDRFRQDLVYEQAAEIVGIEDRLFQVDQLLAASAARGHAVPAEHCAHCGAPLLPGAKFCPNCGQAVAEPAP
jgi:hypothetical protein